jgi:hypothetical protein
MHVGPHGNCLSNFIEYLDSENCSATDRDNSGVAFLASVIWKGLDNKTGSRNRDGNVPRVNWNPDNRKIYVNWYNPDNSNDNLRSRSEVSVIIKRS